MIHCYTRINSNSSSGRGVGAKHQRNILSLLLVGCLMMMIPSSSTVLRSVLVSGRRRSSSSLLWVEAFSTAAKLTPAAASRPLLQQQQQRQLCFATRARSAASLKRTQARSFSTTAAAAATRGDDEDGDDTALKMSAVEDDIDLALEDILGNVIKDKKAGVTGAGVGAAARSGGSSSSRRNGRTSPSAPAVEDKSEHMEGSHPMPATLVEEDDPVDFNDPAFLSTSNPRWVDAGLSQRVIDVLSRKGITQFTPVQGEAFEPVLAGRDVIGRSRTGTGKTLAFGLPGLTRLVEFTEKNGKRVNGRMARGRGVSMLILCPTRELARQVQEELFEVARPLGMAVDVFHGGVSYNPQAQALRRGLDVLVGTPGRIMDHMDRGNLDLTECDLVVLDEADEMLNMGFAEDVEVILADVGTASEGKPQCLLFSATTPPWVTDIGRKYQKDVLHIDSTSDEGGARVAKTVRHLAVQLPPGADSKKAILEDVIAVEISRDEDDDAGADDSLEEVNPLAAAAAAKKRNSTHAMQQKVFGKTIVFTETKREADELVSGGVFKSLSAQALHGDVGQKQRDATLNAFRAGAFNVLVATDVAARGIDIKDVDLVVQFAPPRDTDTYVHRSGRTGRAGKKGVSVLMFDRRQARDIVRIERGLGHGFKFDLVGPPSIEAALKAAARTSAAACTMIPSETAQYFKESAAALLADGDAEDIVARCLAAISRRSTQVHSRSLITGEVGVATVEMTNKRGRPVAANDVMFTVGKLSRMSRRGGGDVDDNEEDVDLAFDSDVGKIQTNPDNDSALFDMSVEDAKKLVAFSQGIDAGGAVFSILKEMEIERDRNFGRPGGNQRGRGGGGGYRGGGRFGGDGGGRNNNRRYQSGSRNSYGDRSSSYRGGSRNNQSYGGSRRGSYGSNHENNERGGYRGGGGESRYGGRNDNRRRYDTRGGGGGRKSYGSDDGW